MPLSFTYRVELDGDPVRRFVGEVDVGAWQSEYLRTPEQAAWAFCRRMCDRPGTWRCLVWLSGELLEPRLVDVSLDTECFVLFRSDRPADPPPADLQPFYERS
ncbi:MAG: hypothetical protein ACYTG0_42435 [Planctomycetota bacterium]|jgi:hypothetical protein